MYLFKKVLVTFKFYKIPESHGRVCVLVCPSGLKLFACPSHRPKHCLGKHPFIELANEIWYKMLIRALYIRLAVKGQALQALQH